MRLAKLDREFYVMQGDIYVKGDSAESGVHEAAVDKMEQETPDFVVFNGSTGSLAKERALKAKIGSFSVTPGRTLCRSSMSLARFSHPEGAAET